MKRTLLLLMSLATSTLAYEALQGPTELLYWDKTNTCNGYTRFVVRGATYLVEMEEPQPWGEAHGHQLLLRDHVAAAFKLSLHPAFPPRTAASSARIG